MDTARCEPLIAEMSFKLLSEGLGGCELLLAYLMVRRFTKCGEYLF
jgi:hypothetical protein